MKYIRTKDGRIIDTTKEKVSLGYHPKESDTIKELCDCFVFKKEIYRKIEKRNDLEGVPMIRMFDIHFFDLYEDEWERIYGAIWVKGKHNEPILKSVAKMNEKGELELL